MLGTFGVFDDNETCRKRFRLARDTTTIFSAAGLQVLLHAGVITPDKMVYDDGSEMTVKDAVLGVKPPSGGISKDGISAEGGDPLNDITLHDDGASPYPVQGAPAANENDKIDEMDTLLAERNRRIADFASVSDTKVSDTTVSNTDPVDKFTVDVQEVQNRKGSDFVQSTYSRVVSGKRLNNMRTVGSFSELLGN